MRKLTLSKETLRVLDDDALAEVVGGHKGSDSGKHHKKHKKHNPGSRGSGRGPSGGGPPGCKNKSGRLSLLSG